MKEWTFINYLVFFIGLQQHFEENSKSHNSFLGDT